MQHITGGESLHHGVGDEFHQKVDRAAAGQLVGIAGVGRHGGGVQLADVHVHADTGLKHKGQHQTQAQGEGGEYLKVDQRLDADPAHALQVARAGDAMHHHAEHQHRDDHFDQLDESITQGFELDRELRNQKPQQYADDEGNDHLPKK